MLREKYNIFKGLVGLADTKLGGFIIVVLILSNAYFIFENQKLNSKLDVDKKELYGMVISAVKNETDPIRAIADSNKATVDQTKVKLDTLIDGAKNTLKYLNKKIKK